MKLEPSIFAVDREANTQTAIETHTLHRTQTKLFKTWLKQQQQQKQRQQRSTVSQIRILDQTQFRYARVVTNKSKHPHCRHWVSHYFHLTTPHCWVWHKATISCQCQMQSQLSTSNQLQTGTFMSRSRDSSSGESYAALATVRPS